MRKGKIDLEWVLKEGKDDIYLEKVHRTTIQDTFLILRQAEIDQSASKDTKIWKMVLSWLLIHFCALLRRRTRKHVRSRGNMPKCW